MSAADNWRQMVEAEEAQSESLRTNRKGDYWSGLSGLFRQDPKRQDDPEVEALAGYIDKSSTVIDVGAGAGRLALPLALRCSKVMAVEPSSAMVTELKQLQAEHEIANLEIIERPWEDATLKPADLVFAAHVVYTVKDIRGFVDRLTRRSRRTAGLILWLRPPLYWINPIWSEVFGVERLQLPTLPELLEVLWEMDIAPELQLLPPVKQRGWPDKDSAVEMLRHRLFIGDDQHTLVGRLREAVDKLLIETDAGWTVGEAPLRAPVFVHWPGNAASGR